MTRESLRNVVPFCAAFALSAFGYEFVFFIMTVLVYRLSGDALHVGLFTVLTFVPRLFSPVLGGLADTVGRTRCLTVSCVAAAAFLFLASHAGNPVRLGVFWFGASVFLTFIVNLRGSLTADVVSRGRHAAGNAFGLSVLSAARLLGPVLGGLAVTNVDPTILIRSACPVYLAAALASAFIAIRENKESRKPGLRETLKKGIGAIAGNRTFGLLASIAFLWRLFLGLQAALFVVYVGTALGGTDAQYGFFMAALGVGSIAGSFFGPLAANRVDPFRLIAIGMGGHYASFAALGFCGNYTVALCLAFAGQTAFYMTLVGMHAARDAVTPPGIRSGAYGAVTAVLTPAGILSMLAGSSLAGRFGAAPVLSGAGLLALLSLFTVLFLGRRSGAFDGVRGRPAASRP